MDRRDILRRSKAHKTATLLGFLTGHLPAAVQQDLAHEIGINAVRLTEVSAIPELVPAIVCLNMIVGARIGNASAPRIPFVVLLLAGYMLLDGAIRFKYAWLNNRPMGSVFGLIGYGIYYLFAPHEAKRVAPLASEKGWGIYEKEIDADVKLRDAVRMREPLFTLLSAREQQRIAERYDFDYRRHASAIAWVILVFALLGAATEFNALRHTGRTSALISMLTAGYLGSEQIYRLTILGTRPVGSAIGYLVRPFLRRFL